MKTTELIADYQTKLAALLPEQEASLVVENIDQWLARQDEKAGSASAGLTTPAPSS